MLKLLGHTEQSFSQLASDDRSFVLELSQELASQGITTPFEGKQIIWKSLNRHGIRIPPGIFENMEQDDSLEMWSLNERFLFAMGSIIRKTSYSLDTLASLPWSQLFTRDPVIGKQTYDAFVRALETGETQSDVADWHVVTETASPDRLSILVKVKQTSAFSKNGVNTGIMCLVKTGSATERM